LFGFAYFFKRYALCCAGLFYCIGRFCGTNGGVGKITISLALVLLRFESAWGENDYGQVGDGITWDDDDYEWSRPVPVQVVGPGGEGYLTDVAAISAGNGHSLALRSDGLVWAWGKDEGGRLGNGAGTTWEPIPFPVRVLGINGEGYLSGVKAVAAGENFSLALLSDSTVCAWGNNGWGQLGDGTKENRLVPVRVPGLSGVIAVDGGGRFSVAACSDGSIWSWGDVYGNLKVDHFEG